MLAFASKKYDRSSGFVQLMIDEKHTKFLKDLELENNYQKIFCYHFESLSTTIREFKTLKMIEFSKMAPIIFQPTLSLSMKDQMLNENKKTVDQALGR